MSEPAAATPAVRTGCATSCPLLVWLVLVWILLWGTWSWANLISRRPCVALAVTVLLPLPPVVGGTRLHPVGRAALPRALRRRPGASPARRWPGRRSGPRGIRHSAIIRGAAAHRLRPAADHRRRVADAGARARWSSTWTGSSGRCRLHVLHVARPGRRRARGAPRSWPRRSGWSGRSAPPTRSPPWTSRRRRPAGVGEADPVTVVYWARLRHARRRRPARPGPAGPGPVAAGPGGRHRRPAGHHLGRARGLRGAGPRPDASCRCWSWCRCWRSSARSRWPATSAACSSTRRQRTTRRRRSDDGSVVRLRRRRRRPAADRRRSCASPPGSGWCGSPTSSPGCTRAPSRRCSASC